MRSEIISAIMRAQGYANQLEQYEIQSVYDQKANNPVFFAEHKLSGIFVAIKVIENSQYERLR